MLNNLEFWLNNLKLDVIITLNHFSILTWSRNIYPEVQEEARGGETEEKYVFEKFGKNLLRKFSSQLTYPTSPESWKAWLFPKPLERKTKSPQVKNIHVIKSQRDTQLSCIMTGDTEIVFFFVSYFLLCLNRFRSFHDRRCKCFSKTLF